MPAFRRFDPYAVLGKDNRDRAALARLAGLAGAPAEIESPAEALATTNLALADENQDRGDTPAKAAKAAKADGRDAGTLATFATLAVPTPETENPTRWSVAEEERAAIVEHDGGIPRAWAEGFARLHPDRPPGDVPPRRWLQFVDDVGRFLDSDFAAVAAALGWGPYDLFGCDRDRPFARLDQAGLLWLLNGDRLRALTENTATIERRTGARQTYGRKTAELNRVLAWELAK